MKGKKFIITAMCAILAGAIFCGCSGYNKGEYDGFIDENAMGGILIPPEGNFRYEEVVEQGYYETEQAESSYFSLDRNTASYTQVRAQINANREIAADSVRLEELVNYFSYDYPLPEKGEEIRATAYLSECPWNENSKLVTIGVRTEERVIEAERNNYVFLVDVSGSMSANVLGTDKTCLGLVKYGIEQVVSGLTDNDAVSIVTYAGSVGVALEPTRATEKGKKSILNVVKNLDADGSTSGEAGINLAYECAEKYYSKDGNNRVILMTDGDFNVGLSDTKSMEELIRQKSKSGVYLSVIGVGIGNMRDDIMQTLAVNGNGNYAYLDNELEAKKVLCDELNGTLVTVAKDAKAGVTFSKESVKRYRLLGYDSKVMSEEDFNDENKDAGEIGSNLCVTAMYEIELKENVPEGAELAEVVIRYQSAESGERKEAKATVRNTLDNGDARVFAGCVAEFALVLRSSQYKGKSSLNAVMNRLESIEAFAKADVYRSEFYALVQKANVSELYSK